MIPAAQQRIPSAPITAAGAIPAFVAAGMGLAGAVTGSVGAGIVVPDETGGIVLPEDGSGFNRALIDRVLPVPVNMNEVFHCS
jgi:hypothetical protein